jgi:tripartite-type tricarboxylate transporter receptor subunit TctC
MLASAQSDDRPVKIVVPFAAGGGTDVVGRLVATRMATILKAPVIVENRAGAGGAIGASLVAKSPADGLTLLLGTVSTQAINPALSKQSPYDPLKDFAPVSLLVVVPQIVVVNAKQPYRTLAELVDAMKKSPGKITYGSQGLGGISHLMGELLNSQAKVSTTHVPYRGAAPALQDLLAGTIDVMYDTLPALQAHIADGRVRALAVASSSRLAQLPNVPTTAEAGMPGFIVETWNALFAPAQTPPAQLARLSAAAREAVNDAPTTARLQGMGAKVVGSSPEELGRFVEAEVKRWTPVVKASGATID